MLIMKIVKKSIGNLVISTWVVIIILILLDLKKKKIIRKDQQV